jgi:serine/threonine protein kinase
VLKIPRQSLSNNQEYLKDLLQEAHILSHAAIREHKNIINLENIGWVLVSVDPIEISPALELEYAINGNLIDFEASGVKVDYRIRKGLCAEIADALQTIHSCGIVHGDIKPRNILIFDHPNKRYMAKICDFGCSILVTSTIDSSGDHLVRLPGYTPPWHAPEAKELIRRDRLYLTDIFSFGLLIWNILKFGDPFSEFDLPLEKHARLEHIAGVLSSPILPEVIPARILKETIGYDELECSLLAEIFRHSLSQRPEKRDLKRILTLLQHGNGETQQVVPINATTLVTTNNATRRPLNVTMSIIKPPNLDLRHVRPHLISRPVVHSH